MKKTISKIISIINDQHEDIFRSKMSLFEKKKLLTTLEKAEHEGRLPCELLPNGEIGYFFHCNTIIMPENKEKVVYFHHCFCLNQPVLRRKFYAKINQFAVHLKKINKIENMYIEIFQSDTHSIRYFSKKGSLTATELVGRTRDGLRFLNPKKQIPDPFLTIEKLKTLDVKKIAELERLSHLQDTTSRMIDHFRGPDGLTMLASFYAHLNKLGNCFVLKKNRKIIGGISFFIDEKKKRGLVASVFVTNEHKGKGYSKVLYKALLEEFARRKLPFYLGSSTTERVLSLSEKLGRVESISVYIVKL